MGRERPDHGGRAADLGGDSRSPLRPLALTACHGCRGAYPTPWEPYTQEARRIHFGERFQRQPHSTRSMTRHHPRPRTRLTVHAGPSLAAAHACQRGSGSLFGGSWPARGDEKTRFWPAIAPCPSPTRGVPYKRSRPIAPSRNLTTSSTSPLQSVLRHPQTTRAIGGRDSWASFRATTIAGVAGRCPRAVKNIHVY